MPLPVAGLWTIRMAVTRRMPEDTAGEPVMLPGKNGGDTTSKISKNSNSSNSSNNNAEASVSSADGGWFDHDPTDWVSIRMGPTLTSLHHVADIKNVVNDDFGEVNSVVVEGYYNAHDRFFLRMRAAVE